MNEFEIIGRLLLAALCGGLIGFERETAQKSAGIRTHTLVSVGAAVFTVVSIIGFEGGDESRVAAQIVTGIGFLGAGAIFKEGATVKGLTTAAGLWVVAAIGLASGAGKIALAIVGTVTALAVLYSLQAVDEAVARRRRKSRDLIEVEIDHTAKLESVLKFTQRIDPDADQVSFKRTGEKSALLTLSVAEENSAMLAEMLLAHKAVERAEVLSPLFWPQTSGDA